MPFRDSNRSRSHVELLMNISATLADYTQSMKLTREVPSYLSRTLDLEPLTLAIIQQASGEQPAQVALVASSGHATSADAFSLSPQDVMTIHDQTRARKPQDGPALSAEFANSSDIAPMDISSHGVFPRAVVFARTLDERHRMLLIVHQRHDANLADVTAGLLQLIADQLATLLTCLMAWVSARRNWEPPSNA